ncbi:hypothetical protein NE237_019274 [Protea cynaroides]|uniref:Uncharacterized protein n=1 Tax=Protea cynaroides TaxID=273540 RepID=A0A9Q0QPU1_9MAGN|nr:hypothetical protein NE237_019274 [Protea cynaroides]
MASNMTTSQTIEKRNVNGVEETVVETVDYRSYPGQDQGQLRKNVQVIHQVHPQQGDSASGTGVLGTAAAAVANTIQSAKAAITGTRTDTNGNALPISQRQAK